MVLTESIKEKILSMFKKVEYGRITFHISPEKKTLDCIVEQSHKILIEKKDEKKPDWRLTKDGTYI